MARWILWGIAVEDDEVEGERGGAGVRVTIHDASRYKSQTFKLRTVIATSPFGVSTLT